MLTGRVSVQKKANKILQTNTKVKIDVSNENSVAPKVKKKNPP